MKRVVLIYETMPERTIVLNLLVTDEEFAKLLRCHGRFGNCVGYEPEDDELLNDWLPSFVELRSEVKAFDTSVEEEQPPVEVEGVLIHSGFNL